MNLEFGRIIIDADTPPATIERYAGYMYIYRYELKQEEPITSEDRLFKNRYSFVEVRLKGYPNRNETVKYLLRQLVSLEDELKLINDYNESIITNNTNSTDYSNYVKYLTFRREVKSKVNEDFTNAGY